MDSSDAGELIGLLLDKSLQIALGEAEIAHDRGLAMLVKSADELRRRIVEQCADLREIHCLIAVLHLLISCQPPFPIWIGEPKSDKNKVKQQFNRELEVLS